MPEIKYHVLGGLTPQGEDIMGEFCSLRAAIADCNRRGQTHHSAIRPTFHVPGLSISYIYYVKYGVIDYDHTNLIQPGNSHAAN